MSRPTPGPWVVVSGAVQTEAGVPIAAMDREPGNGTLPVERDCNARLIAAAPELLAALRAVVDDLRPNRMLSHDAEGCVRAAIAKAVEA